MVLWTWVFWRSCEVERTRHPVLLSDWPYRLMMAAYGCRHTSSRELSELMFTVAGDEACSAVSREIPSFRILLIRVVARPRLSTECPGAQKALRTSPITSALPTRTKPL